MDHQYPSASSQGSRHHSHASRACKVCAHLKRRCDGKGPPGPCARCVKRGTTEHCKFSIDRRRSASPRSSNSSQYIPFFHPGLTSVGPAQTRHARGEQPMQAFAAPNTFSQPSAIIEGMPFTTPIATGWPLTPGSMAQASVTHDTPNRMPFVTGYSVVTDQRSTPRPPPPTNNSPQVTTAWGSAGGPGHPMESSLGSNPLGSIHWPVQPALSFDQPQHSDLGSFSTQSLGGSQYLPPSPTMREHTFQQQQMPHSPAPPFVYDPHSGAY